MGLEQSVGELAPADFPQESFYCRLRSGIRPHLRGMPDLAGGDLAPTKVRRQTGCAVPVGTVTAGLVILNNLFQEIEESLGGCGFSRNPAFADAAGPVWPGWQQAEA
jgi:hypothetical protein